MLLAGLALSTGTTRLCGYAFEPHAWAVGTVASPTQVTMQLQLQDSPAPAITTLQDGSTSWNQVAIAALTDWNQYIALLKFAWVNNSAQSIPTSSSSTNHNNVFWDSTVYGDSWGSAGGDAVGITIIWSTTTSGSNMATTTYVTETDVLFNTNVAWDSYRGVLQNNVSDLRRVALHEFGHVLGLNHPDQAVPPQSVAAIMNSITSATDNLTVDDIGGGEYLYGAPGLAQVATPPASQTVDQGNAASFFVQATGLGPITYQWLKNGLPITGNASATTSTLTLANLQASDAASYSVTVTNASGPVTSAGAPLTVIADVGPAFTTSPIAQTISTGRSVAFNVIASGVPTPTYQWKLNGSTTIPGATFTTDPILWVQGATASNAGSYSCTITNSTGTVSAAATLSVVNSGTPGYLTNVSARGLVGTGSGVLIGGFSITGTGQKTILVRGDGPALVAQNVPGAVTGTTLELYSGSTPITVNGDPVENTGWGTTGYPGAASAATLNTAFAAVGAFPLTSGSLDSAILITLQISGSAGCSGIVSGVGGATGNGLVEVYDDETSDAPAVRLTNVSARDQVGTGGNILFGGFSIAGNTAETLLIRSLGPGLTIPSPNLTGTLTQPVLTVYNGSTPTYSNTIWGGDPVLAAGMALVGAYALPSNSTDAAVMITLAPGNYTVLINGVNGTTGIATVEIYEIQ
jgi:hypothetical protein